MAEGAMPGAPQFSGTEDDSQHFTHQPPPVEGINFGSQPDAIDHTPSHESLRPPIELRRDSDSSSTEHLHGTNHVDFGHDLAPQASPVHPSPAHDPESSPPPVTLPSSPQTPRRARFPSDVGKLTRTYSAPKRTNTDTGLGGTTDGLDGTSEGNSPDVDPEKGVGNAEDQVQYDIVHRGMWVSFRRWIQDWANDFGRPHEAQDIQDMIGDIGLDIAIIERVQGKTGKARKKKNGHNRISSIVGASTMLARPGLGSRSGSAATVNTIHSQSTTGNTTAASSGTATPNALKKVLGSSINANELRKQLNQWKKRAEKDPEEAKFVQAKSDLAHRRTLVLLLVSQNGMSD